MSEGMADFGPNDDDEQQSAKSDRGAPILVWYIIWIAYLYFFVYHPIRWLWQHYHVEFYYWLGYALTWLTGGS